MDSLRVSLNKYKTDRKTRQSFIKTIENFLKIVEIINLFLFLLFRHNNYQGNSVCLTPSDSTNCYPGFYKKSKLDHMSGKISSVRKGCFNPENIIKVV